MFSFQNMQTDKSVAEEIELLTCESKLDNSGQLDLPLLSPTDLNFLSTESVVEGVNKTAPPPPPNSLKTTLCPQNDLIQRPSNIPIKSKKLLSLFTRHYDINERTRKPLTSIS